MNFFFNIIHDMLQATGLMIDIPHFEMVLPVGISFFTFMAVGYVVDVYKQKIAAERNILDFALFIGFFPQIASGPIGRGDKLIPQFKVLHPLLYRNITAGARMMLWGFFMKLVVGDRAGIYVDTVFGSYAHHNGTSLLLATFMYTIQIYCDFAGYSLIAIGAARMMGYELMENFRRPYFAVSVGDFWRKWHISLSTWFRDYVYIPLGGSREGKNKTYRNLMVTFLASGLWHGAAYNFLLWGGYHGLAQVLGKMTARMKNHTWEWLHLGETSLVRRWWNIAVTFAIVSYGWMMFYAPNLRFIVDVTKGYAHVGRPYIHQTTLFFFLIGLVILLMKDCKDEFFSDRWRQNKHPKVRQAWHYAEFALIAVATVWMGVLGGGQFIYFKF